MSYWLIYSQKNTTSNDIMHIHTHTHTDTNVFKTHLSSFLMGKTRQSGGLTDRKVNHCDHFSEKNKNNQAMMAIMIMIFLCVSLDFPLSCFYWNGLKSSERQRGKDLFSDNCKLWNCASTRRCVKYTCRNTSAHTHTHAQWVSGVDASLEWW